MTTPAEPKYSVDEVRARFEASFGKCPEVRLTRNGDGYLFIATDHRWDGWKAAYADMAGEVRELAEEVIESINDGDAQSARNAAQAALAKFQEKP